MTLATIFADIESRCHEEPDSVALTQVGGRQVTYGQFEGELNAVTAGLVNAGLRAGDVCIFSIRPGPEAILLLLAIVRCGGVVVAADPGMSPNLFAARMALLKPRWVMAESSLYLLARFRFVRVALERRGVLLPNLDLPGTRWILVGRRLGGVGRSINYRDLVRSRAQERPAIVDPSSPAVVVFTSGTTSAPKGVVHTGASIGAGLRLIANHLQLGPEDRVYSDQLHLIVPALMAGAQALIPHRHRAAASELADLAHLRPTHAYWVPVQLEESLRFARATGAAFPESLRVIILASAPVRRDFLLRCARALPRTTRVYTAYAMTEILPVAWVEMQEQLANAHSGDLVGRPCPGVRVRIAADGEVFVAGPNLCQSYLGQPALKELPTGDLGELVDDRLVLLGRKKEMIIRGSHNIYPSLLEGTIGAVPGVRRCALIGIYDERRADEVLVLAMEPEPSVDGHELTKRVQRSIQNGPRRIDIYARPDHIVIIPIPLRGRSSKVDRIALAKTVAELLHC